MRIALVFPPPWARFDMPPLGIASLAGFLGEEGHEVRCWDLNNRLYRVVTENHRALLEGTLGLKNVAELWSHHDVGRTNLPWYGLLWTILHDTMERALSDAVAELRDFAPDLLGISVYSENAVFGARLAARAKEAMPALRIVLGGPAAGKLVVAEHTLPAGVIDAHVFGEGEPPLLEIVSRVAGGLSLEGIGGVAA